MSFVNRNWYLKGSSEAAPPVPFATLDYVLCAVEFFLWASPLTQTSPRSLLLSTNNRVIRPAQLTCEPRFGLFMPRST